VVGAGRFRRLTGETPALQTTITIVCLAAKESTIMQRKGAIHEIVCRTLSKVTSFPPCGLEPSGDRPQSLSSAKAG
jgi:hypothetical protein